MIQTKLHKKKLSKEIFWGKVKKTKEIIHRKVTRSKEIIKKRCASTKYGREYSEGARYEGRTEVCAV